MGGWISQDIVLGAKSLLWGSVCHAPHLLTMLSLQTIHPALVSGTALSQVSTADSYEENVCQARGKEKKSLILIGFFKYILRSTKLGGFRQGITERKMDEDLLASLF